MFLLVVSEVVSLFVNIFTGDQKPSLCNQGRRCSGGQGGPAPPNVLTNNVFIVNDSLKKLEKF